MYVYSYILYAHNGIITMIYNILSTQYQDLNKLTVYL